MSRGTVNQKLAETLRRARKVGSGEPRSWHDPFDDLRCSIVFQALVDWLTGQKVIEELYGVSNLQELRKIFPDKESWSRAISPRKVKQGSKILCMIDAEKFFNSEYCEDLCGIEGKLILSRLKSGKISLVPYKKSNSQKIQAA